MNVPYYYTMRNFYNYWGNRIIKDGLRAIKIVIGLGLSFSFGVYLNPIIGLLFLGWVFVESLIEKK
jgi:hypothetical protein